jgi:hypothetical protein
MYYDPGIASILIFNSDTTQMYLLYRDELFCFCGGRQALAVFVRCIAATVFLSENSSLQGQLTNPMHRKKTKFQKKMVRSKGDN